VIAVSNWTTNGTRWYRTYRADGLPTAAHVDALGWAAYWPDGHLIARGTEAGEKGQTFADLALWSQGLLWWEQILWWRASVDVAAVVVARTARIAQTAWVDDRSECRTVKLHAMLDVLRRRGDT
jgi:hypothetical protein